MCGIAGIFRFDERPIDQVRLQRMLGTLAHRGPDGQGITQMGRCALVHTRLSIIDLLSGAQPMHLPAAESRGELSLIFNGEIYNHRLLRKKLERAGHRFASDHSDTEVLLHGYRQFGSDLPKHLQGMFAFAIYDHKERRLFLARDRAGEKPLYLHWSEARDELMFASLPATLVRGMPAGQTPVLDPAALRLFLQLGYTLSATLYRNIVELPAACWMMVESDGRSTSGRYWQPPPVSRTSTAIGAVKALREILEEAVTERLEADVPLGCFLSGGIDSSLVAALAQRQLQARGAAALHTFNVAMPHAAYNEEPYAQQVAKHIGSRHTTLTIEPEAKVIEDLQRLIALHGEPFADSSVLPTYWLSRAAREHVTVALSGDGGDELFGGYDRYRALRLLHHHAWWLAWFGSSTEHISRCHDRSTWRRWYRLVDAAKRPNAASRYLRLIELFDDHQLMALAGRGVFHHHPPMSSLVHWPQIDSPAEAAMRWDFNQYLPFDLLRKVDRASMAVALEVRCPLLDTQVCDFAAHLPLRVLMPGGWQKGLLRQAAKDLLPREIVHRRKQGFAVPIGHWFRTTLREELTHHLQHDALENVGLSREVVGQLLQQHLSEQADHTHRLFTLLNLSLWAQQMKSA